MTKFSIWLIALAPFCADAETYLCVAEAGALVKHGGQEGITAAIADVSNQKYIQTNDSGKWLVKELGKDYAFFDKCASPYFCERANAYAGTFLREPSGGIFSITWMTQGNEGSSFIVAKGRCSKL